MNVWVTCLYASGVKRDAVSMRDNTPIEGRMEIVPLPANVREAARFTRMATVKGRERPNLGKHGCAPLYDPQIVSMDERSFTLRGYNVGADRLGQPAIYGQRWVVRVSHPFY